MKLKDVQFLNTRNISINFFGSLIVSQDAVMKLDSVPITDYKVYEGLMNSSICHGFNDILAIDLKELVRMYVFIGADKKEAIEVLGYLIDHGVVYEHLGASPIRYAEPWHGTQTALAWYEHEAEKFKAESEEGIEEKG